MKKKAKVNTIKMKPVKSTVSRISTLNDNILDLKMKTRLLVVSQYSLSPTVSQTGILPFQVACDRVNFYKRLKKTTFLSLPCGLVHPYGQVPSIVMLVAVMCTSSRLGP